MASKPFKGYQHDDCWDAGFLKVDDIHQIHYEQYGKKDGIPVIFLHGGPGSGARKSQTVFFNPAIYRAILFDQRGAGQSLPLGEVRENTSLHLVSDIEALRTHLSIARWHVFGGSWGSTLAILYAQCHPAPVVSLTLRGVFMESPAEFEFGLSPMGSWRLRPELYERFLGFLPTEERGDVFGGYYRRLTSGDRKVEYEAARRFNEWADEMSVLLPEKAVEGGDDGEEGVNGLIASARIECHYHTHNAWLEDEQFLRPENIDRIKHIPCAMVNGRYDLLCPPIMAWRLHKALPGSQLYIIEDAGHSAMEPGTRSKLVEVCDEFSKLPL